MPLRFRRSVIEMAEPIISDSTDSVCLADDGVNKRPVNRVSSDMNSRIEDEGDLTVLVDAAAFRRSVIELVEPIISDSTDSACPADDDVNEAGHTGFERHEFSHGG